MEQRRKRLIIALVAFLTVSITAVLVNSFLVSPKGLDIGRSISRYVGFETWSAVLFAITNVFVGGMIGSYLWKIGEDWKMSSVYFWGVLLLVVMLFMLSFCPIGYYDVDGQKSLVSYLHEISSRTMFVAMLVVAGMLAKNKQSGKLTRRLAIFFILYGVLWIAGFMTNAPWMMPIMLILEALYITWFIVIAISCKSERRIS